MVRHSSWSFALVALALFAWAGRGFSAAGQAEASRVTLFRDLRAARNLYREKLTLVAGSLEASFNTEADQADAKGSRVAAMLLRGRAKIVANCDARLKDLSNDRLDDVALVLQAALFDEVPSSLIKDGLNACFLFKENRGSSTKECVSGELVTVAAPDWVTVEGSNAILFSQDPSVVKVHVELQDQWTVIARIHFPVEVGPEWATLLWNQSAHVLMNKATEFGVWQNGFHGSGFKAGALKGWHLLAVRAKGPKTTFYVDGERRGESNAAVYVPIEFIGNWGYQKNDYSQKFCAPVSILAIYGRALQDDEIRSIKDEALK
jgi:hypothetical protein